MKLEKRTSNVNAVNGESHAIYSKKKAHIENRLLLLFMQKHASTIVATVKIIHANNKKKTFLS